MKTFHFISLFIAVLVLSSCEKAEESSNNTDQIESGTFQFRYKGTIYFSEYKTIGDDVLYQNEKVGEVVNRLKNFSQLASYIHKDSIIEYFDTFEELENNLFNKQPQTRAFEPKGTESCTLTMYDDTQRKGKRYSYKIDNNTQSIRIGHLDVCGMNDNISSLDLISQTYIKQPSQYPKPEQHGDNCMVTLFQHENGTGESISFSVTPYSSELIVNSLKDYKLRPGSSTNWNDRISSIYFRFVQ